MSVDEAEKHAPSQERSQDTLEDIEVNGQSSLDNQDVRARRIFLAKRVLGNVSRSGRSFPISRRSDILALQHFLSSFLPRLH